MVPGWGNRCFRSNCVIEGGGRYGSDVTWFAFCCSQESLKE